MNADGLELLKEFEGFREKAYIPVPGDVPTIGYGFTEGVKMGDTITVADADARLAITLQKYEAAVSSACDVHTNENELAAMVCFAYNIGLANFQNSTVLKAHNRGDIQSAARAFGLFNKSGGKVLAGLTRRRAAESALYLKPVPETQADHPMPQTIDPETPLATRPLSLLGGLTGAGGVLGAVSNVSDQVNDTTGKVSGVVSTAKSVRGLLVDGAAAFGFTPLEVGCVSLMAIGAAVLGYRYVQRSRGWV